MPKKCAMGRNNGFSDLEARHARIIFSQADIERKLDHHEKTRSAEFVTARDAKKPIPDEDGNILMHHWSEADGLTQLDPTFMGKMDETGQTLGLRDSNFRAGPTDPPYSSFGLNVGHPLGYIKEEGLGPNEYITKIPVDRIYDIASDPDDLRIKRDEIVQQNNIPPTDKNSIWQAYLKVIKDAGYAGIFVSKGTGRGLTAAIWESMPVEQVKPRSDALAESTASKYSNLVIGWGLSPEIIAAGRAQSPKNEYKQPEKLESLGKKKLDKGINLDEDVEWARAVILNKPIEVLGEVQEIPTFRKMIMALKDKATKGLIRKDGGPGYVKINEGELVKARLDIPAYTRTDTWIVTVHDSKSGVIGYAKSAVLRNVLFGNRDKNGNMVQFSKASNRIAAGVLDSKGKKVTKSPFATMQGYWVDVEAVEARRMANEALASDDWVEVGFNPQRYGYFYVKETGEKILRSPEVVQVGPLLMANIKGAVIEPTAHSTLLAESMAFTKFNDNTDYIDTNNHDVILQERIPDLSKLEKMRGGGDRAVYRISEDKVVKVATTKRGLAQNALANEYYLRNNEHWPRVFEIGKDYVIMEYVPRNDIAVNRFLAPLKAEGMYQGFKLNHSIEIPNYSAHNKKLNAEWQEAMTKLGLEQFMEFDLAWADFTAFRNWGMKKDGTAVLVDEGAIDSGYLDRGYDADGQYQADWNRILERRRQTKKRQTLGRKRNSV